MILHILHADPAALTWSLLALSFMFVSAAAMRIFWHGVRRASTLTIGTRRRIYALDTAWGYLLDEWWRFTQHLASFMVGVVSFFITPTVRPTNMPRDAVVFGFAVLLVLFYLNIASGINTIRALRTWRRRERFLSGQRGETPQTRKE